MVTLAVLFTGFFVALLLRMTDVLKKAATQGGPYGFFPAFS